MDYDNVLRVFKKSGKFVIWGLVVIAIVLSFPFLSGMLFIAWSDHVFRTTKPDAQTILATAFPSVLVERNYFLVNSERVKFGEGENGVGHVYEGGACAIIELNESENIDELKLAIIQKFSTGSYGERSSITKAERGRRPNSMICNFLNELSANDEEFEILATSRNCEGERYGGNQECSAFYNPKLNQILIESLDYDGDHASSFP